MSSSDSIQCDKNAFDSSKAYDAIYRRYKCEKKDQKDLMLLVSSWSELVLVEVSLKYEFIGQIRVLWWIVERNRDFG